MPGGLLLDFRPEERLLLLCARLHVEDVERREMASLLEQPLLWDEVLKKAQWHKLAGLVYYHLREPEFAAMVPPEVLEELRGMYYLNIARQLYFKAELTKVLAALNEREIPVIVLKGAALAETVYAECGAGLRPMADLDLLVPHDLADAAYDIVRAIGYTPTVDLELQEKLRASDRQLAALIGIGKPVIVEIHTHIVEEYSPVRFDIRYFWEHALETTIADVPARILTPEDLLAHLGVNFLKDRRFTSYAALGQLWDIAEVTRGYADQLHWPTLVRSVEQAGLNGPVFCALYLSARLLDAAVPEDVLKELEPPGFQDKDMVRFARQRVLGHEWVAKELIAQKSPYHWWAMPASALMRIFPSKRRLVSQYQVPILFGELVRLYLERLREAITILVHSLQNPVGLYEDLAVDRWLHSLYKPAAKSPPRPPSDEPATGRQRYLHSPKGENQ